uniref:Candidate secreted effector n=1 Tax=Meloidogyne incognita TaxID=6306 RepID=A0A914LEN5_MELIC
MNYNTECCVGTSSSSSFSEERLNKNINSVEVEQNQSCSLTTGVLNEENNGGGIHSNKNNLPVVGGSGRENTESQIDKLQQNQSCSSASNPGVLNDESNGGGTPVIFLTCEYIGVGGGDRNMEDESMEQLQQNQSGSPSEGENACSQGWFILQIKNLIM